MTREDKDSLAEMLAQIPVTETRGSLLSAIGKLLRVIDVSESSIMIPTLLKDKCEFDAYEMLTLAKILKASILGHNDLVEFYMSESSSHLSQTHSLVSQQKHKQQLQLQQSPSATPSLRSSVSSDSASSRSNSSSASGPPTPVPAPALASDATSLGAATTATASSSSGNSSGSGAGHTGGADNNSNSSSSNNSNIVCADQHTSSFRQQQQQLLQLSSGDPDATVRLLVQIEQLKVFIPQVTSLFESIIELYKNSVDTITCGAHN